MLNSKNIDSFGQPVVYVLFAALIFTEQLDQMETFPTEVSLIIVLNIIYVVTGTFGWARAKQANTKISLRIYFLFQSIVVSAIYLLTGIVGVVEGMIATPLILQIAVLRWYERILVFTSLLASFVILELLFDGQTNPLAWIFIASGIALISIIIQQEQEARGEAEQLALELKQANIKLTSYSKQVEELTQVKERNRLARDLHDSVTQSLYSLTLFAEATRHLAEERGDESITRQVEQIASVAQQVLKEMRLLVYELRPSELEQDGLIKALDKRLGSVEKRAGVDTEIITSW